MFWKKIKLFVSDKGLETNNIILKEKKKESITNSSTLANLFNLFNLCITITLKLNQSPQKFPWIPNLLIHNRDHKSIKEISLEKSLIRRSKESHKIFEAISSSIPVKLLIDSADT